jgi:hypothetical protein
MKLLPLLVTTAAARFGESDLIAPLDPRGIEIVHRLSELELPNLCAGGVDLLQTTSGSASDGG